MNIKEEPPDDYFKCLKVALKHVLKHYEINLLFIEISIKRFFSFDLRNNCGDTA